MMSKSKLPVVSLFSGAGGLDLAVELAGTDGIIKSPSQSVGPYSIRVATDYSSQAMDSLVSNFPETNPIIGDIRGVSAASILEAGGISAGDASLVVGGPPCTPFSKSGFWLAEKRESRDPNASLLEEYVRMVAQIRPEAFVLENVQALTYKTHRIAFQNLIRALSEIGYNPQWKVLSAADFGVPQLRKRVFIVGRRDGRKFDFPEPTHGGPSETSRDWDRSKIPHVTAGEALAGIEANPEYGEIVSGKYGELAAEVPPGFNYLWHTERYQGRDEFKWRSRYWTFLLKLSPDKPSSTLQAQPGPYVGPFHWENVVDDEGNERARRLRVPEIKKLMTFPAEYQFTGSRLEIQRQIGNAVPVALGRAVMSSLATQLGHI